MTSTRYGIEFEQWPRRVYVKNVKPTNKNKSKQVYKQHLPPQPTLQQKMNTYLVYVIIQDISQKGNSYKLL